MIQSPLNYTGGKYKLLPQILPLFPSRINTFVDLFCGGCNVGLNVPCNKVYFNDSNKELISLYAFFRNSELEATINNIYNIIEEYQLSLVSRDGYSFYNCQSGKGLADYNKERFLHLRADFNERKRLGNYDAKYYLMLYVLIVYSFNNQLRFNSKGEFNLPVGKRDFNRNMELKLRAFIMQIKEPEYFFTCMDYRNFDISSLASDDLVYVDPPYLITCATYNEQGGWGEQCEQELLAFLDGLQVKNIRFALSNVLKCKGKENEALIQWLNDNKKYYKCIPLKYSYANSNYQKKDKSVKSDEVLIVNYKET